MTIAMPRVYFHEFLQPNSRPYNLAADQNANLVGMRWYGGGPFHRELKLAHKIQKKSHFVIKSNDVIYNKLFAWKGAFGVVPNELDGMYVSDKFPTYHLHSNKVSLRYLAWYFRHHDVWEQARKKSRGSAAISKLTLNPPQFLELQIPLPSLFEQNVIAERLDHLAARIAEAKSLRAASMAEIDRFMQSAANSEFTNCSADSQLGSVLTVPPRNGWSPKCDNDPNGTPVLTLTAVTGWHYDPTAFKRTSLPTKKGSHYWLKNDDLLITRSNTPEFVGHVAIYNGHPYPCIYPDLMMKLSIDETKTCRRFVWWWLQSRSVRDYIAKNAKGSSPTMKKISQGVVMAIPYPSRLVLSEQKKIAARLDALHVKIAQMQDLQYGTLLELEAMLPAILDRAYNGEL
jgi:type I restriction enzyme, S subunit